jgi:hypothetical protein
MRHIHAEAMFHGVAYIRSKSTYSLGMPLVLELRNADGNSSGTVTIYVDNEAYLRALIKGINEASHALVSGHTYPDTPSK